MGNPWLNHEITSSKNHRGKSVLLDADITVFIDGFTKEKQKYIHCIYKTRNEFPLFLLETCDGYAMEVQRFKDQLERLRRNGKINPHCARDAGTNPHPSGYEQISDL
jgi:hypothetical protein